MLYRKYRPQRFSELVALDEVVSTILSQVKEGTLAHAYLFSGPKGVGKTTSARLLAKAIFCENPGTLGEPCGICPSCLSVQNANTLDLIEIDAASNRGIDDIRNLKEKVVLSPSTHTKKIYIIDEVHMLTKEAFNALLKTLEEPPEHAVFVLCTTEINKVPATILSRCVRLNFPRASKESIIEKLTTICEAEGREVPQEILGRIAESATGGYRDAETLLMSYFASGLLPEIHNDELLLGFLEALIKKNRPKAMEILKEVRENQDLTESLVLDGAKLLSDLLIAKYSKETDNNPELLLSLRRISEGVETSDLIDLTANLSKVSTETISGMGNLPLLIFTLEWCSDQTETRNSKHEIRNNKVELDPSISLGSSTLRDRASGSDSNEMTATENQKDPKSSVNKPTTEITDSDWDKVLNLCKAENQGLLALLKGCKLLGIKNGVIELGAMYTFHLEKLKEANTLALLNKIVGTAISPNLRVKVTLLDNADSIPTEAVVSVIKKSIPMESEDAVAIFSGDIL